MLKRIIDKSKKSSKSIVETKTETKKHSFIHSSNVIITKGSYKGYHGLVKDFYPKSYEVTISGNEYVDADKYFITDDNNEIGKEILTQFGKSKIIKYISKSAKKNDVYELIIYKDKDTETFKIGYVSNNKIMIHSFLANHFKELELGAQELETRIENTIYNPNNTFVLEIDTHMTENVNDMQSINTKMQKLNLNENLLDDIANKLENKTLDFNKLTTLDIVYKKDIITNYYITSSGKYNLYRQNLNNAFISYKNTLKFNSSEFIKFKSHIKNKFELPIKINNIVEHKSKLDIILVTNGKLIHANTSDVFYLDLLLNPIKECQSSDVFAEVLAIESSDKINVKVLCDNDIFTKTITKNDINEIQPGFSFNEQQAQQFKNNYNPEFNEATLDETLDETTFDETTGEEPDPDSRDNFDYEGEETGEGNEQGEEIREDKPESNEGISKSGFKDFERSGFVNNKLTSQQTFITNQISKMNDKLNFDDNIDVYKYKLLNQVEEVIKCFQQKYFNTYTKTIPSSDIKYIIICIILYDNKTLNKTFDKIIDILYPDVFTLKDISTNNLNDSIFLFNEHSKQDTDTDIANKIKHHLETQENKSVIKILISLAKTYIEKCLNINIVLDNKNKSLEIIQGNNYHNDKNIKRQLDSIVVYPITRKFLTINDIIDNNTLPSVEVKILWEHNKHIKYYSKYLQKQINSANDTNKYWFSFIKDNLLRLPFFIRDTNLPNSIKNYSITILDHIKTLIKNEAIFKEQLYIQQMESKTLHNKERSDKYAHKRKQEFEDEYISTLSKKEKLQQMKNEIEQTNRKIRKANKK